MSRVGFPDNSEYRGTGEAWCGYAYCGPSQCRMHWMMNNAKVIEPTHQPTHQLAPLFGDDRCMWPCDVFGCSLACVGGASPATARNGHKCEKHWSGAKP